MVLGVASVLTATRQHAAVGMLNTPLQIRLWLSRGRPEWYSISVAKVALFNIGVLDALTKNKHTSPAFNKYWLVKDYKDMPLESAVSAMKATALPGHLLYMAVIVFLAGFGLYILFQWLEDVGGAVANRNIFVVFTITVGLYVIYDALIVMARVLDRDKRSSEFKTDCARRPSNSSCRS